MSLEEHVEHEKRDFLATPGWIAAKYGGECGGCGESISVGDPITKQDVGLAVVWVGRCCTS
jgi:hypothetical protein